MKSFRSLAVVKRPSSEVFEIVRDRLVDLVPMVDDIKTIEMLERHDLGDGIIEFANRWTAAQRVPDTVARVVETDEIAWIDHNLWSASEMTCRWTIEPCILTEHIHCAGMTTSEPAMGGRGCRVTLEGTFDLAPAALARFSGALRRPATSLIESMVSTIIPRGTRKLAEAAVELSTLDR